MVNTAQSKNRYEHYKWLRNFTKPAIEQLKENNNSFLTHNSYESLENSLFNILVSNYKSVLDSELFNKAFSKDDILTQLFISFDSEKAASISLDLLKEMDDIGDSYFDDKYHIFKESINRDCSVFIENIETIIKRILNNKEKIEKNILNNEFSLIVDIKFGVGDLHNNHQSTSIICTDAGEFVYHPRDCRMDEWYYHVVKSLYYDITYSPKAICINDQYGFSEYIDNKPANSIDDTKKYFYNFGGLCAITKVLGSSDIHYENILAKDSVYPVLVDLETIICGEREYPFGSPKDSFNRSLLNTLCMKSILPLYNRESDIQLSPLLNKTKANRGLPIINGEKIDVLDYEQELLDGFTNIYNRSVENKNILLGLLDSLQSINTRLIIRPSQIYSNIMNIIFNKSFYISTESKEKHINTLIKQFIVSDDDKTKSIVNYEFKDLINGDIPLFNTKTDSKVLLHNGETVVDEYLIYSAYDNAKNNIISLNDKELLFEQNIIKQGLASAIVFDDNKCIDINKVEEYTLDESTILTNIYDIFNEVKNSCLFDANGNMGWLLPDDSGNLQVENIYIKNGISGLALFFASVACSVKDLNIKKEVTNLCVECLHKIDIYLDDYFNNSLFSAMFLPIGMFEGIGGVLYAVYKCNTLLDISDNSLINKILKLINNINIEAIKDFSYEKGLCGLSYALKFINNNQSESLINQIIDYSKKTINREQIDKKNIELSMILKILDDYNFNLVVDEKTFNSFNPINKLMVCVLQDRYDDLEKLFDLDSFYGDNLNTGNTMCVDILFNINSIKTKYILHNMINRKKNNGLFILSRKGELLTTNSSFMFGVSGIGYELVRIINSNIKGIYFGELLK